MADAGLRRSRGPRCCWYLRYSLSFRDAAPHTREGHPPSRLPLIADGVVHCANQGCTLYLADDDPVAEGLAAVVKSAVRRCQNRGDGVRLRASHW